MSTSDLSLPDPKAFHLAEYAALRGEIVARTGIQHQLILALLTAAGVFLGIGIEDSPEMTAAFPALATFLAVAWVQSDLRVREIGEYIKDKIEPAMLGVGQGGWQASMPQRRVSFTRLGSWGLILATELLVPTVAWAVRADRREFPTLGWVVALIPVLVTVVLLLKTAELHGPAVAPHPKKGA